MSVLSASILLFMVMDPFGNIPLFLSALNQAPTERHKRIVARESFIALVLLVGILFAGPFFLRAMQISDVALRFAGGLILLLIAIKMVFGRAGQMFEGTPDGEPLIVPLAVPYIAGPTTTAMILVLVGQEPGRWPEWLLSLFLAWLASTVILLSSTRLAILMGARVMCAVERLMGLILTAISAEMFLRGIHDVLGR